jgi:hypothetical protein
MTPEKPCPAVQIMSEAEATGKTSDAVVDQELVIESVGCNSLPDVPLAVVSLPDVPIPDVPFPAACPDRSFGEE